MRAALFLKAAKCLSITSLWVAIAGWLSGIALYEMVLRLSVTAGAVVVMSQALRLRRYAYSALFASLALLYNPVAPIMSFLEDGSALSWWQARSRLPRHWLGRVYGRPPWLSLRKRITACGVAVERTPYEEKHQA